jgi:hypothetical protein
MSGQRFPFRHGDHIQHAGGGQHYIVRLVDDEAYEAYAEPVGWGTGVRVINPDNWKFVSYEDRG